MKVQVVIDWEVTPRVKRWALRLGIPAAVLAGVSAIAYASVPVPFTANSPLRAGDLNADFTSLDGRVNALEAAVVAPGSVVAYAGVVASNAQPPAGWLLCDGSSVSRTQYAALFAAIGTSAGAGDGSGTFNLPDYRGLFLRGFDQGNGADPNGAARTAMNAGGNTGDEVGTVESDAFASHAHSVTDPGHTHTYVAANLGQGANGGGATFPTNIATNHTTQVSPTGITIQPTGGSETRPKNAAVNYLIKT
jgi:microcystin-dependent protein